jgi:hypothetical protein
MCITITNPHIHCSSVTIDGEKYEDRARQTTYALEDSNIYPVFTRFRITASRQPCWNVVFN